MPLILVSLLVIGISDVPLVSAAPQRVATPTLSPVAGTYFSPQNVTILCATVGATIRYTLNGAEPTSTSILYTSPIPVTVTTTIKAKAFLSGMTDSLTQSATYTLRVATPTFNPAEGTYSSPQKITIKCDTASAVIHYTVDGTTPTSSSSVYSEPISMGNTTTMKAKAFLSGWTESFLATATYNINLPKVEKPTFSPYGGIYFSPQNVTILCTTVGATIRYTLNGAEPTSTSIPYTSPIPVTVTTTIKAKAFKNDMTDSDTATVTYTISIPQVATPTFSPVGGTYSSIQNVVIQCATPGATIRFTTDDSEPSSTSTLYSAPISLSVTTTLRARAFMAMMTESDVSTATYVINLPKIETPTFSPVGATFSTAQSVVIQCATTGVTIRYTTNGTEPTSTSTVYSIPILVSENTMIKAKAFKIGWTDSETASASYAIKVAPPTFNPLSGTYSTSQMISLSCSTSDASLRYTTDGSEPNLSSTIYSGPIPISSTTTIKAKASKNGMTDSDTATATYTITPEPTPEPNPEPQEPQPTDKVSTPTFNPTAGTYTTPQNVKLDCNTPDATIHYTIDGTEPTASSAIYTNPILVSTSTTIKAKASKTGMSDSDTATTTYTITSQLPKVATPTFSPETGSYSGTQSIVIRCSTPSAIIRYTINGAEPSSSSLMYSGPISISVSTTIKAKAFMFSGMTESDTATATYTVNLDASSQQPWFENATVYSSIALVSVVAIVEGVLFYLGRRRKPTLKAPQ